MGALMSTSVTRSTAFSSEMFDFVEGTEGDVASHALLKLARFATRERTSTQIEFLKKPFSEAQ